MEKNKKLIATVLVLVVTLLIFANCVWATEDEIEVVPANENEEVMPSADDFILQEIENGVSFYNYMCNNYDGNEIKSDYFRVAKENNKTLKLKDGLNTMEWNFFKITNTGIDFNPGILMDYHPVTQEYYSKVTFNKFLHTGAFPGEATLKVLGRNENSTTNSLQLFKYNETSKIYTYVGNAAYDGEYYSYNVSDANSIYAIAIEENPATKSMAIGATISEVDFLKGYSGAVEEIVSESLESKYFENAKATNKDVVVSTADKKITWEFVCGEITNTSIDLKTSGTIQNKKFEFINNNYISNDEGIYIDFDHSGELPGKAKLTVNVGTEKFGTGSKKLYLYYYNPVENTYVYKGDVKYSNGEAEFNLNHCSTYVLIDHRIDIAGVGHSSGGVQPASAEYVGGVLDNEPKTGEISLAGIFILSAISLAAFVFTKQYK